jgi:3-oxoacyl-(acyl-carrier-protein) synthase
MSICLCGLGAVSPAGWGVAALRQTLERAEPVRATGLPRPGWDHPMQVRQVPAPQSHLDVLAHPRLRRASPISRYVAAAGLEALGEKTDRLEAGAGRLGLLVCVMSGCVNYSRRFYDEVLKEPASASPLLFPETVFNAPASHLAAVLGETAMYYTLVGDPGTFLQALALAADWLLRDRVDGCLVVGAEEADWTSSDAFRLFARRTILAEGAGAVYLRRADARARQVQLHSISNPHLFLSTQKRSEAVAKMRAELPQGQARHLLCEGRHGMARFDTDEARVWRDWPGARLAPKMLLGEGLMAASAWQCVAAIDALQQGRFPAATVSVVGCNEQAIGAHFVLVD